MVVRKLRKLQHDRKVNYSITLPRVLVEELSPMRGGTDCIVTWVPVGTSAPDSRGGYFAVYALKDHVDILVRRLCAGDVGVVDEILQNGVIAVDMLITALESTETNEVTTRILPVLMRMTDARVVRPAFHSIMANLKEHPRQCPICGHAYEPLEKRRLTPEELEMEKRRFTPEKSEMVDVIDEDFAVHGWDFKWVDCDGELQHICRDCYDAVNHDLIDLMTGRCTRRRPRSFAGEEEK